jgi:hypothetical protein
MNPTLLKAVRVILISLGLALIFNFLFFGKLIGISVLILVIILLGAVFLFGMQPQAGLRKTWWLVCLIIFFALMPGIRANELLTFLNVCATFGLLMLLAHELAGTPAFLMRLKDYIILIVVVPFRMLARAFYTISLIGQIHSSVKHRDVWLRVFKGVVMAVPILIIFAVLFSQADLAFSQFIKGFVDITISQRTVQYLVLLVLAFVASMCFLSYIFFPKQAPLPLAPENSNTPANSPIQPSRGIEVLVFLGLISALFLVFIGFQITYLFGGEANIINAGFTYAEYARRGFWELLAASFLSLLVLLASEKYAGIGLKKDRRFLIPALGLIAEVAVVMVSAFKRLSLYIDAYGMTMLRFYVAGFIVLLLALFIILTVKFIKSKQEQFFAFGTLLSIAAFLIIVNVVNPDAFIVKFNMAQYNRTGKLDASYLRELSADAEPEKIELYNKLGDEDKEVVRGLFQKEKEKLQRASVNWQSANLSRTRGLKLLDGVK